MDGVTRRSLINQIKHGIHIEDHAIIVSNQLSEPCSIALYGSHITAIHKLHTEALPHLFSSGRELRVIFDIDINHVLDAKVKNDFMACRLSINNTPCSQLLIIFYRPLGSTRISTCQIYTISNRLTSIFLSLWRTNIVTNSLNIKQLHLTETDKLLAAEYCDETANNLCLATNRKDLLVILNEFCDDCKSNRCLFEPEPGDVRAFSNDSTLWSSCVDNINYTDEATIFQTNQSKACAELIERLQVYLAALNVLVGILFGSDIVHLKHRIVEGPSPMTVSSWLPLIICDVQTILSSHLGVENNISGSLAVEEELKKSLQSDQISSIRTTNIIMDFLNDDHAENVSIRGSKDYTAASLRTSRTALSSLADLKSKDNIKKSGYSNLEKRVQRQIQFSTTESTELMQVRQSVLDMQVVLLYFLCEISMFGKMGNQFPMSKVSIEQQDLNSAVIVDSIGNALCRLANFDFFLEEMIHRLLVILDDFMSTESVSEVLKNDHFKRVQGDKVSAIKSRRVADSSTVGKKMSDYALLHEPQSERDDSQRVSFRNDEKSNTQERTEDDMIAIQRNGFIRVPMSPKRPAKTFKEKYEEKLTHRNISNKQYLQEKYFDLPKTFQVPDFPTDNSPKFEQAIFLETQVRHLMETDLRDSIVGVACILRYLCPLKNMPTTLETENIESIISKAKVPNTAKTASVMEKEAKKIKMAEERLKWLNEPLELNSDKRNFERKFACLSEFIDARFNLTDDSWNLLLLASLEIEKVFDYQIDK